MLLSVCFCYFFLGGGGGVGGTLQTERYIGADDFLKSSYIQGISTIDSGTVLFFHHVLLIIRLLHRVLSGHKHGISAKTKKCVCVSKVWEKGTRSCT